MVAEKTMFISLSVDELQTMIRQAVNDALDNFRQLQTPTTETRGATNCAKVLGTYEKTVTDLLRNHTLGTALWKRETSRGNSPVMMETEKATRRYRYYIMAATNVREAFDNINSIEQAEQLWQSLNL